MKIPTCTAYSSVRAYYPLESNGNDAKNSYHLTLGSPTFAAAKYGNGAVCTSAFLRLQSSMANLVSASFSLAVWFKWAGGNTDDRVILSASDDSTMVAAGIGYYYNGGTRRLSFWRDRSGPGTAHAYYVIDLDTTQWYHLCITYDGTNILGYVNGVQVTNTTQSGNGSSGLTPFIEVGGNTTTDCNGTVDDAGFWPVCLSAAQVKQLAIPDPSGFVAFL